MERRLSVVLAVLGVAGAVVWIGVAGKRTPPTRQIDSALAELEMAVRETAAGTQARAVTLSQLPRLSWAVETDEATVRDLTSDELAFRPQPRESIEIAQVERVGGAIHRLILIPADGRSALSAPTAGLHLIADGDQVRITAVMKIDPRERTRVSGGLIGVAQQVDLSRAAKHFEALGIPARLETSGRSVPIGNARPGGGRSTVEIPLQSPAAGGAKMIVQIPLGMAWGHVTGALLLAVASVVSATLLAWHGGRRAPAPPSSEARPSLSPEPSPVHAPLSPNSGRVLSDEVDETTLVGTDSEMALVSVGEAITNHGEQSRPVGASGAHPDRPLDLDLMASGLVGAAASTMIPSSLFVAGEEPARAAAPVLPAPDSPWALEYRRLFREFVKLRRTCSESTQDLDRDRFIEALHQKRLELMEQDGAVDVKFRLAFNDGKAAVRFKLEESEAPPVREGNG